MVAQDREEDGLAEHFPFDVEEHRPLRGVVAVGNQVAGVEHEVRIGLDNGIHYLSV
jgi:hypothetical protein